MATSRNNNPRWRTLSCIPILLLLAAACTTNTTAPDRTPTAVATPTADLSDLTRPPVSPYVLLDDPTPTEDRRAPTPQPVPGPGEVVILLEPGSLARYRVTEQLARRNLPNDAVGETSQVSGAIVFRQDGTLDPERSGFTIRMDTLKSDESRRDNYLRRNAVRTASYPLAKFVPQQVIGAPWPLPDSGTLDLQLVGEMTIRDTTAPVTWDLKADLSREGATGQAKTSFTFGHFGMSVPRLFFILSVEDNIRLELDFVAVVDRPA